MRQYLLDLSLEEMSIDLLLQGDFKGREKGIKETPFSIAKKKKNNNSGFIPSSGIFISILCVGVILKNNERNGNEA